MDMKAVFLEIKIQDYTGINVDQIENVSYPNSYDPAWTIIFKDGEIIKTTMPTLVSLKWEEIKDE